MTLLLKLSQLIDWLNERVARGAFWLVLVMTIISAQTRPAIMCAGVPFWLHSTQAPSGRAGITVARWKYTAQAGA